LVFDETKLPSHNVNIKSKVQKRYIIKAMFLTHLTLC